MTPWVIDNFGCSCWQKKKKKKKLKFLTTPVKITFPPAESTAEFEPVTIITPASQYLAHGQNSEVSRCHLLIIVPYFITLCVIISHVGKMQYMKKNSFYKIDECLKWKFATEGLFETRFAILAHYV